MQITLEDLIEAVEDLKKSTARSAKIAVFYLKRELKRRENSGRPTVSALSRKEQVSNAVKRFRSRSKAEKKN